jgi:photosystem II stability/assembly factor-like uncharacterized protein
MSRLVRIFLLISLLVLLTQYSFAAQDRWSPAGLFNFSGFYRDELAFDPSHSGTIYASAGVGLYRTTNSGSLWKPLDLKGLLLGQNIIRVDPANNKHIVVGGFPIFESFDSGENWSKLSDFPSYINESEDGTIEDIQFHPSNSSILYLVNVAGVLKSTDGGKIWVRKNHGLPIYTPQQIQIDPNQPETLYVSYDFSFPQFYKSTDGGESWHSAVTGMRSAHVFEFLLNKSNPQILIAAGADGIFRTQNGAASWNKVDSTTSLWISADPNNSQKIYVSSFSSNSENHFVLQSNDGGITWNRLVVPSRVAKTFVDPHDSSTLYTFNDQGILISKNAGKSWKYRNAGILEQEMRQLESHPSKKGLIFAIGSYLFRSVNSGKSWQTILPDWRVDQIRIHPANPNLVFAATNRRASEQYGTLLLSRDSGTKWEVVGRLPSSGTQVLLFDSKNNLYAGFYGLRGVYKSTDEGRSWFLLGQGISRTNTMSISVSNQGPLVFAVSNFKLYRSENSGNFWKLVSSIRERLFAVAIHPKDSKTVFVGGAQGTVFKSIDGGITWQKKHQFEGGSIYFIRIDRINPNLIYAGADNAIYVSIDKGENWSVFDTNGLSWPSYQLKDLLVKPWGDPFFVAATQESVWTYQRKAETGQPVIRGLSSAAAIKGETLIIYGNNFGSTPGTVDFNGFTAQSIEWSDQVISVSVPSDAKTGSLKVIANGKQSNHQQFVAISNSAFLNPTSGPGGEPMAIVLPYPCRQGVVLFGLTVVHDVKCIPPNIVVFTSPPGQGSVEVTYQSAYPPSSIFKAGDFTYSP